MIKVFIPSLNRPQAIRSHLMPQLKNSLFDWYVVVHSEAQKLEYLRNKTLPPYKIIVSDQPHNLSLQRNWIRDNLVGPGEWFLTMNDNIEAINIYPEPYYSYPKIPKPKKNNRKFQLLLQEHYPDNFDKVVEECLDRCSELGTGLCGFSAHENYFFRGSKWRRIAMVTGRMFLCKNDELRCRQDIFCMEDYEYSCQAMLKYGRIMVAGFVYPKAKFNEPGGLGRLGERAARKVEDCKKIMALYPGLFRYKQRVNSTQDAEIVLRGHTEVFFNKWRQGYEKEAHSGLSRA